MCECTWRCDKSNNMYHSIQLVPQTGYVILYLNQYHCKIMCQFTWSCEKGNFMIILRLCASLLEDIKGNIIYPLCATSTTRLCYLVLKPVPL